MLTSGWKIERCFDTDLSQATGMLEKRGVLIFCGLNVHLSVFISFPVYVFGLYSELCYPWENGRYSLKK